MHTVTSVDTRIILLCLVLLLVSDKADLLLNYFFKGGTECNCGV